MFLWTRTNVYILFLREKKANYNSIKYVECSVGEIILYFLPFLTMSAFYNKNINSLKNMYFCLIKERRLLPLW